MSSTASARTAPSASGAFTHRQILTILSGLLLGMFLAALDQTIVATAIRTIGDDLHGLSVQAWVTTAYLITSTISTPLYGKLSDLYGRKPFFLFAISIFIVGSALVVLDLDVHAGRVPRLPGHRRRRPVLHGAGDHGRHRRRRASGPGTRATSWPSSGRPACSARWSAASSPAGAILASRAGAGSSWSTSDRHRWRSSSSRIRCTSHHARRRPRIDWWGAAALIVGLVPLLIVAEQGRTWGWSPRRACRVLPARHRRRGRRSSSSRTGWGTTR